jgi:general secretion pathway protein H
MSGTGDMRRSAGFTLVELLVVIAILALAAAVATPRFTQFGDAARVRTAESQIAAALRRARADALSTGREATVAINVESGRLDGPGGARRLDLPANTRLAMLTARSELMAEDVGRIRFYGDGASTGGVVEIQTSTRVTRIVVDWLTGRVRVDEET